MNHKTALAFSEKVKNTCEAFGMRYVGGGYGNINDKSGSPFEFSMNFLCAGEKITVSMSGDGDFDPGPFEAP